MKDIFEYGPAVIRWLFIALGGFTAIMLVLGAIRGVIPVLWRLGKSLHNRKIALYSDSNGQSLKTMLTDSNLFKEKNIHIISSEEISKGLGYTMMIIYYPDFKESIKEIISQKKDEDSLIVYAPRSEGNIKDEVLNLINKERNSIIVNMRGRLLNDVLTAMITTNYGKK